jgi:DNA (cytosine-5)-methyltransferase 1
MARDDSSSPRFLDLFCGIGGLSLGLERAGFEPVGGIDLWEEARATFERNHPACRFLLADVTKTAVADIERQFGVRAADIDIVAGGPPCQGFSTVGKRNAADPRNGLWRRFRDLVAEVRPAYVLIENVEGMLVMQSGKVRDAVLDSFAEIGYHMKCKLLRAADYGVPQLRKRAFFLGWLEDLAEPHFPRPLGEPYVTVADAIFDLPPLRASETKAAYEAPPLTAYQAARRKGGTVLYNHEAANHPKSLVEVLRYIPDGGNRKSIPDHAQPKSGFHNSYARLASWKPAIAVTSNMRKPSSARATHPTQHRGLTVREGLRLQSFDDDFVVLGSRTSQYLQVGNAVPPLLALAVGKALLRAYQANSSARIRALRGRHTGAASAVRRFRERTLWETADCEAAG